MGKKSDIVKIARIQADSAVAQEALRVGQALAGNPNLHFTIAATSSLLLLLLLEHNKEWWGQGSEWWAEKITSGAPGSMGGLTAMLPLMAIAPGPALLPIVAAAALPSPAAAAATPGEYDWWAWLRTLQGQ